MAKTEAEKAAKQAAKAAEAEAAAKAERKAAKAAAKAAPEPESKPAKTKGKGKDKAADDDTFATAGTGGDLFRCKDWEDDYILFYPHRVDKDVTTPFGTEPEVPVGKVVVLDASKPGTPKAVFPSTPVFGKALMNALRPSFDAGRPTPGKVVSRTFKSGDGWDIVDDPKAKPLALKYIAAASAELLA